MKPQDPEPPGASFDASARSPATGFAGWLVLCAARRAPAPLAGRLAEEWLADLATRTSALTRLRFALGCCWAVRVIASEHAVAAVAVAAAVTDARVALVRPRDADFFPRNSLTVIAVVAFHVVVFYALVVGLDLHVAQLIPADFQVRLLPDPRPAAPPPSLPHPIIRDPVLRMPSPELPPTDYPDDAQEILAKSAIEPPPVSGLQAPGSTIMRVTGGPGAGFPTTDEYYPAVAMRREEQGSATVQTCVDAGGRLTSAPTIAQSSGYPRLDEGALQLARAGSGHYRPSTEDGRPVSACYAFRVRFQLRH
jgi:protein TonB